MKPGADAKISVVMPNYNKGPFALEAVQSVLSQKGVDFELIFVDDGSTDGSDEAVRTLAQSHSNLHVFHTATNQGGATARNLGLAKAAGHFVLFMDSDDVMSAGALRQMMQAFSSHPECDFIAFPMSIFRKELGDTAWITNAPKPLPDLLRFLQRDHPWLISGPLWKRSFLQKLGGFDERLSSQQDFDLHVRALLENPAYHYFAKPALIGYRQEVDSLPRQTSQSLDALRMRAAMLKGHLELMDARSLRSKEADAAIAQYLLELACMVRWHKQLLGANSAQEGLRLWLIAHEFELVNSAQYTVGMGYIRFMHNMLWNRVPGFRRKLESIYHKKLGALVKRPDSKLGHVSLHDV